MTFERMHSNYQMLAQLQEAVSRTIDYEIEVSRHLAAENTSQ